MSSTPVTPSQGAGSITASIPSNLVYALGTVGYDFGSEARRDTFKQLMPTYEIDGTAVPGNPYDARQMVDYLEQNPSEGKALIWTHGGAIFWANSTSDFCSKYTCRISPQSKIQGGKKTRPSPSPRSISYLVKVPLTHILHHSRLTGFPACSTKSEFSCEAGKPVHKKLIENGATSQVNPVREL
jgi:hypothetical protein